MPRFLLWSFLLLISGVPLIQPASAQQPAETRVETLAEVKAWAVGHYKEYIAETLKKHCYACHGDKKATAGLNLQQLKPDFVTPASAEQWRRVLDRVRFDEMPPRTEKMTSEAYDKLHEVDVSLSGDIGYIFKALKKLQPHPVENLAPVPIHANDSPSVSLQRQLRNTAAERLPVVYDKYVLGRSLLTELTTSIEVLAKADYLLATTREERIASLQRSVNLARVIEDDFYRARGPFVRGIEEQKKRLTLRVERLSLEFRLQAEIERK